ncbi:PIN/TRAM domain-containing protein [Lignipirellula cremea]|uniref:Putative PIN and TRAM-domain containing protein n=1 Tax=Lignipirellula cremea TaxID=2528010 RepID=A0A518DY04_9BACT|nr:PIN domain-containing protein [Lignipirellula cremea]QDU96726.1 putative PIN and TRAM-domain containing protein precursor [Lignipirellula cremea]
MALWILRFVFILVSAGVGVTVIRAPELSSAPLLVFSVVMASAFAIIGVDAVIPRKRIEFISSVYFGLVVGLLLTYIVVIALTPLFPSPDPIRDREALPVRAAVQLALGVTLSYICISLLMQTKDDLRFVIPYVEFSKEVKGLKPYILDTSVVIDGRISDVVETGILDNQLIMPRFVLNELQGIADSSDRLRRARGRRGLDVLNQLRASPKVDLKIHDRETPEMSGQPVDMKLVLLAKHLDGKVVTGDYNLNKVARVQNVPVINLNDIANALKPIVLPGEELQVYVVKPGEVATQGVGYLDDGTMVVIEGGRPYINRTVKISVTSVLQNSAGRMIFGRFDTEVGGPEQDKADRPRRTE